MVVRTGPDGVSGTALCTAFWSPQGIAALRAGSDRDIQRLDTPLATHCPGVPMQRMHLHDVHLNRLQTSDKCIYCHLTYLTASDKNNLHFSCEIKLRPKAKSKESFILRFCFVPFLFFWFHYMLYMCLMFVFDFISFFVDFYYCFSDFLMICFMFFKTRFWYVCFLFLYVL